MKAGFTGLIAAPHTPMTSDGQVDLALIERQAELLARNGVKGAFVAGTNGEGMSLTVTERMTVALRWREVVGDSFPVVIHVGHTCVDDSKALAIHAQKIGADAFSVIGPCFFRPGSVEDLVAYCAEVAAVAPDLPFYYYHIPAMSGVNLPMYEFLKAAGGRITNLAGMKFTYEDLMDFGMCLELEGGRYNMLFGRDEMLLAGLAIGARGAVGSTYNFAAPLYLEIMDAFERGDMDKARALQEKARQMIQWLRRLGGLRSGKAIMRMIGMDCGPVRSPVRDLTPQQCDELRAGLEAMGFFEFCSKRG